MRTWGDYDGLETRYDVEYAALLAELRGEPNWPLVEAEIRQTLDMAATTNREVPAGERPIGS